MRKRLVFFWYVDCDRESSPVYTLHMNLLCRYSNVFNEALFVMSLKETDDQHRSMAMRLGHRLVSGGYVNARFIFEANTELREAKCFHEHVRSAVVNGEESMIFFGHNKGLTNTWTESLLTWICSMYFFSLERRGEAFDAMEGHRKAAYGFPVALTSEEFKSIEIHPLNGFYYAGAVYWINAAVSNMALRLGKADDTHPLTDRFYAEEYVGNTFDDTKCGTYANIGFWNNQVNFYDNMEQELDAQIFDYVGDERAKAQFWAYMDGIKADFGI